jgi:hypothetical protein
MKEGFSICRMADWKVRPTGERISARFATVRFVRICVQEIEIGGPFFVNEVPLNLLQEALRFAGILIFRLWKNEDSRNN